MRGKLYILGFLIGLYVYLSVFFLVMVKADSRVKIAIVDTGINVTSKIYPYLCTGDHYDITNTGIQDRYGHGSMVADIVTNDLDPAEYCIAVIKWYDKRSMNVNPGQLALAIGVANDIKANIINISASGPGPRAVELEAVLAALKRKATLVIAAGNEQADLSRECEAYPGCYNIINPLFHVVADYLSGRKSQVTNYGGPVTDLEDGHYYYLGKQWKGTSVSTAKITNRIAKQHAHANNRQ